MDFGTTFIILAGVFGFFMACGIGANDVANAMGTSVGSKALTIVQAVIVAAIFESLGAVLAGGSVTQTIQGGIIDPAYLSNSPDLLVYGMLAALLSAGSWLLIASYFGWPVSTTHSIVGAIIGFGVINLGPQAVHWQEVGTIGLSWIVTPIIAAVIAYLTFTSIQRLILNHEDAVDKAKQYLPYYIFLVSLVISLVTLTKGLKHIGLHLTYIETLFFSLAVSAIVTFISVLLLRRVRFAESGRRKTSYGNVERLFGVLMVFMGCAMAFAHGSNDVANAIGPVAAVVGVVKNGGQVASSYHVPMWIMYLGAAGMVAGLAVYGYKVIATIGSHITEITPSRGFAAEFATVTTVILASGIGLPISTTQTLVGAVLGVGFARGIAALNMNVIRGIFLSWVITLPVGAFLAVVYFYIIQFIFTTI